MAISLIKNLYYASPYAPLPPGINTSGVKLETNPTPLADGVAAPKDMVLAIRLRLAANDNIVIGESATSGQGVNILSAYIQPAFPLSATDSYMLDAIWVKEGSQNIHWNDAIFSAPIIAAEVKIVSAAFNGTSLTAQLAYGASGMGVGAQVNVYVLTGGVYELIGSGQTQDNSITVPVDPGNSLPVYFISAQAAIPTANTTGFSSFSPPYSVGPPTVIDNSSGIPQAIKNLTLARYNGKSLTVSWELDVVTGCVEPDSSLIQLLSGGLVVASFTGGTRSAIIPLDIYQQSGLSIQVASVANNISSKPISFDLITSPPVVKNVVANKSAGNITADLVLPENYNAHGYLMDGNKTLAGPIVAVNNILSFNYSSVDYNVDGLIGLSIVAATASPDHKIMGPESKPAVFLTTAPQIKSAYIYTNPANDAQWRIDMQWDRLPDAPENIISYNASFAEDGVIIDTQTTAGTSANIIIDKSAVHDGKSQTIQLQATGITGGVSPAQSLTALFTPPKLASLSTTQNQLAASWTASTPPLNNTMAVLYRLVLISDGVVIYTGDPTTSTRAAIPLSDITMRESGNFSVMVSVNLGPVTLQPDVTMPTGSSAKPILTAPSVYAVTTTATDNISTLHWSKLDDATAYTINFTPGNPVTGVATNEYKLNQPLTVGAQQGYSVQATGISNGVTVTGPPSVQAVVPTAVANVSWVRFNGSVVSVEWEAVPGALSYNVQVFDNDPQPNQVYSGTSNETSASFSLAIAGGKEHNVYVQPVTASGTGLIAAAQPLFTAGIFVSQQPSSEAYPYVYAAESMSALGSAAANPKPQVITMYLPEIGAVPGALGTKAIKVPPFTIEPSGQTSLPYKLTIAADAMAWSFSAWPIRETLQSAYVSFLKNIESPGEPLKGATPYGISLVQSAIACALPQTFAEQLYYNFGMSTVTEVGAGYIDLRPGMVLRVSANDYISISQSQLPSWINGYAGANVLDFEIGSYQAGNNWRTGFDAFLSTLSAEGALLVTSPAVSGGTAQAGLAGAADLYYPHFLKPFYRLYFPTGVSTAWSIGSNSTESNFTLVAAANYEALQKTTVNPSVTPTAYFRGRAIAQVMIRILINGNERLVPVGTSLGNVLDQLGMRPSTTSSVFKRLRVYRPVTAAIADITAAAEQQLELRVDWNGLSTYGTGNGLTAMSAPLLPGDQIFTDKTGS